MYSCGPLNMAEQKQGDQVEPTYCSSVRIRGKALRTCRKRWTIGRGGEKGSAISVPMARQDDDDDLSTRIWRHTPLICYWTVLHADRKQSPSTLTGRQMGAPITMSLATEEKVWYKRNKEAEAGRANFILQKGQNAAVLEKKKRKREVNITSCWQI